MDDLPHAQRANAGAPLPHGLRRNLPRHSVTPDQGRTAARPCGGPDRARFVHDDTRGRAAPLPRSRRVRESPGACRAHGGRQFLVHDAKQRPTAMVGHRTYSVKAAEPPPGLAKTAGPAHRRLRNCANEGLAAQEGHPAQSSPAERTSLRAAATAPHQLNRIRWPGTSARFVDWPSRWWSSRRRSIPCP